MSETERKAHIIRDDREAIEVAHQVAAELAKGASERDQQRRLPFDEIAYYASSGLWAMTVPKQYGGAGASFTTVAEVLRIISAADGSIGQIPQNHIYMVDALDLDGTEEQKRFFFSELLRGVRFGNAFSETGGKTIAQTQTRLVRSGSGYVLNGKKFYCTGAIFGDWVPVAALNEDDKMVLVFVERGATGLTVIDDWSGFGQRTTASGTTTIENVEVPEKHVLRHYHAYERHTAMGPIAQIMHAAVDVGIAGGALKAGVEFVRQNARPWIDANVDRATEDPLTIYQFGEMQIRLHAAEAMLRRAGEAVDRAKADPTAQTVAEASLAVAEARVMGTDAALFISTHVFDLSGARSTLAKHNLDRYWRDARTHTVHDPVRWKYYAVGNHVLNGVLPPRHAWL